MSPCRDRKSETPAERPFLRPPMSRPHSAFIPEPRFSQSPEAGLSSREFFPRKLATYLTCASARTWFPVRSGRRHHRRASSLPSAPPFARGFCLSGSLPLCRLRPDPLAPQGFAIGSVRASPCGCRRLHVRGPCFPYPERALTTPRASSKMPSAAMNIEFHNAPRLAFSAGGIGKLPRSGHWLVS
jgi:hypothetical protein